MSPSASRTVRAGWPPRPLWSRTAGVWLQGREAAVSGCFGTYIAVRRFDCVALVVDAWSRGGRYGQLLERLTAGGRGRWSCNPVKLVWRPAPPTHPPLRPKLTYASSHCRGVLARNGLVGSMSRRDDPFDIANAGCLIETLKVGLAMAYEDLRVEGRARAERACRVGASVRGHLRGSQVSLSSRCVNH